MCHSGRQSRGAIFLYLMLVVTPWWQIRFILTLTQPAKRTAGRAATSRAPDLIWHSEHYSPDNSLFRALFSLAQASIGFRSISKTDESSSAIVTFRDRDGCCRFVDFIFISIIILFFSSQGLIFASNNYCESERNIPVKFWEYIVLIRRTWISSETGSLNSTRYTIRAFHGMVLSRSKSPSKLHKAFARHKVLAGIGEFLSRYTIVLQSIFQLFHENIERPSGTEIRVIRAIVGETIEAEFTVAVIRELV